MLFQGTDRNLEFYSACLYRCICPRLCSRYILAAVIYLVIQTQSEYFSSLVTSKTRAAHLTDISLRRLELLGALTGARLINCVHEALTDVLHVNEIVCWSDSLVTLYWIKGINNHFKQFVENRTSEIRKNTEIQLWRHCPWNTQPS